jgi:hypothetical protein
VWLSRIMIREVVKFELERLSCSISNKVVGIIANIYHHLSQWTNSIQCFRISFIRARYTRCLSVTVQLLLIYHQHLRPLNFEVRSFHMRPLPQLEFYTTFAMNTLCLRMTTQRQMDFALKKDLRRVVFIDWDQISDLIPAQDAEDKKVPKITSTDIRDCAF